MTEIDIPLPERVDVDQLKTDGDNPNEMSDDELEALKDNISRYGLHLPIITDKDHVIADGEHRLKAARELGMEEVPVVALDVDRVDRKILRQVHNKLRGEHDEERDKEELDEILEAGREDDLDVLLGGNDNIDALLDDVKETSPEDVQEAQLGEDEDEIDVDVEEGDVWELGRHTVRCADSHQQNTREKLPENFDMGFADPPYNITGSSTGVKGDVTDTSIIEPFFSKTANLLQCKVKRMKHIYICCDWRTYPLIYKTQTKNLTIKNVIVWDKQNGGSGNQYMNQYELIAYFNNYQEKSDSLKTRKQKGEDPIQTVTSDTNVWNIARNTADFSGNEREHFAQKPVKLITRAIKNSTEKNDTVLDPFLGSGSTLLACEQTNRVCHGIELDPHYCQVTINRWEDLTGKTASKRL